MQFITAMLTSLLVQQWLLHGTENGNINCLTRVGKTPKIEIISDKHYDLQGILPLEDVKRRVQQFIDARLPLVVTRVCLVILERHSAANWAVAVS